MFPTVGWLENRNDNENEWETWTWIWREEYQQITNFTDKLMYEWFYVKF